MAGLEKKRETAVELGLGWFLGAMVGAIAGVEGNSLLILASVFAPLLLYFIYFEVMPHPPDEK